MAVKMSLEHLFDSVAAQFTADGTGVLSRFGWSEQYKQIEGNAVRAVVWVPGDDGGSPKPNLADMGRVVGPQRVENLQAHVRSLATIREVGTVYCWAADIATPELERAQYNEARLLWDAWYRAMHLAAHGRYQISRVQWFRAEKATRHYGAAIRTVFDVGAPIPDEPLGTVEYPVTSGPTGDAAGYNFTVVELDHSEHLTKDPV